MSIDPRLAWLIIGAVVFAWLTLTIAGIFTDVEVPASLNGLFLAVAGGAVAKLGGDKISSGKDKSEGGDPK